MRRGAVYCRVGMGVVVRRAPGFCLALCKVEMSCSMLVRRVAMPVAAPDVRRGTAWCYSVGESAILEARGQYLVS